MIQSKNAEPIGLSDSLAQRCQELLVELKIISHDNSIQVTPLTGGVASDIARVSVENHEYCVKFALAKLKVKAEWLAPVHRNAAEFAWLRFAANIAPESAIELYGHSEKLHGFAMEFLCSDDTYLWKDALLAEASDLGEAKKVGALLGRIHAASTNPDFDASVFDNAEDFQALRIEPYLLYTATVHDDLAPQLKKIADCLGRYKQVLVHGDVSPKNILFRDCSPVLLDAECATIGDASFDPSFCLNHLVLKAIHFPSSTERYLASATEFWQAYSASVDWEPLLDIEARVSALLPALMLARVDGKSPVEYLTEPERATVRFFARQNIESPADNLSELLQGVASLSSGKHT